MSPLTYLVTLLGSPVQPFWVHRFFDLHQRTVVGGSLPSGLRMLDVLYLKKVIGVPGPYSRGGVGSEGETDCRTNVGTVSGT